MTGMPKRIAAFGEVMMRLQVPGFALLSQADTLHYTFSGTGVNVLSAMARFGHTGYLVSRLPASPVGDAAEAALRKLGITTSFIVRGGQYLGMYFLENGFGVRRSRVTYTNRLESSFNTAPPETYPYDTIAESVDVVHFCGIALAMNESVRQHMKLLARAVKGRGGTVVLDCNYRPALWGEDGYRKARQHYEEMLELADIVMMNEKDAMFTLGLTTVKTEPSAQLGELIPLVADRYSLSAVAGTSREVNEDHTHSLTGYLYTDGQFYYSDRLTFPVYDRIGAGDAYGSAILHGIMEDKTPQHTVNFAAAASMLHHTVPGDTPMSAERDILLSMTEAAGDVER